MRIIDKDGGFTDYIRRITVTNARRRSASPVECDGRPPASPSRAVAQFSDPGMVTTAGDPNKETYSALVWYGDETGLGTLTPRGHGPAAQRGRDVQPDRPYLQHGRYVQCEGGRDGSPGRGLGLSSGPRPSVTVSTPPFQVTAFSETSERLRRCVQPPP